MGEPKQYVLVIRDIRPPTWNIIYSGKGGHYERTRQARTAKGIVLDAVLKGPPIPDFDYPVSVEVLVYFDKRPYDSSNIVLKLYEDGLVKAGVLENDRFKYVRRTATEPYIDRDNPRIVIIVREFTPRTEHYE